MTQNKLTAQGRNFKIDRICTNVCLKNGYDKQKRCNAIGLTLLFAAFYFVVFAHGLIK